MAIEDALVLAASLRIEPTLATALRAYDAERRPRIVYSYEPGRLGDRQR